MNKPTKIFAIALTIAVIFTACGFPSANNVDTNIEQPVTSSVMMNLDYRATQPAVVYEETSLKEVKPYSSEEVTAIATTLAGECYDDKLEDKRSVAEVICNRVSDENFGETIMDVVSAKGQFAGYYNQSRPISDSDIQIAEETLHDWYENDCQKLSDYLFFCAGPNRENIFRTEY